MKFEKQLVEILVTLEKLITNMGPCDVFIVYSSEISRISL